MSKPTHLISAVAYKSGEADLTWDDLETGEHFGVTIKLTEEQCKQLGKVVPPCVHLDAVNSPENGKVDCRAPHCSPEFVCDGCGEEYLGEPYAKNGCNLCLHCKDVQLYTKRHIADYIAGWTMGSFDDVAKLGQRVAHNALHQLGCEQDGIEAVVRMGASKANKQSLPQTERPKL